MNLGEVSEVMTSPQCDMQLCKSNTLLSLEVVDCVEP